MRTAWKAALLGAVASLLLALGVAPAQAAPQTFVNGSQITTTNGSLMHAHGGGVIKEGNYYYMVGEQRVSGGSLFQAVSMYRSTDLVNWTHVNDILTRTSHPDLNPANIERPKVVYNAEYDHYVLWAHKENGSDYGDAEVAVAVSDTIDGDYTYQGSFRPLGHMSRDSTVFVDTDGAAYLISAARENYDLHIYRLSDDYLRVETLVHQFVGDHREAPAVFKRGGTYFLVTSGATGWNPNQTKYATTTNFPSGSWSGWQNLGDATTYGSQSTYVLEIAGSQTTSYLYMGDRWAGAWGGTPNESGYVWLPLWFPSNSTLAMDWHSQVTIDTATGEVTGSGSDATDIRGRNSGKCVDVVNGSSADGTEIIQYDCHGGSNQQWELIDAGGGYHRIVSQASGKCLDVDAASTANNARVLLWSCNGGTNQQWQLRTTGNYVEIVARHSGKCLDVISSSTANGARLQQYDCVGGANQHWTV
ncbi:RICIN domain-containing protein [Glycomyces sp. NRRL B-16210]|uniref:RICIN domain-containing protein n=1 Tax=Glycomyces sp. NRRL B-16210 TaxID=1463821 RepID=UPI0004C1181D|nr:RICIN domain-containing protein [Glycomyces sp. NRRL B-16210]